MDYKFLKQKGDTYPYDNKTEDSYIIDKFFLYLRFQQNHPPYQNHQ
jgi:hypothetical protein